MKAFCHLLFTLTAAESPKPVEPASSVTTINLNLDGYYGYNFRRPFTGINAFRAYDVSSNSVAIDQAGVVIERLPDLRQWKANRRQA